MELLVWNGHSCPLPLTLLLSRLLHALVTIQPTTLWEMKDPYIRGTPKTFLPERSDALTGLTE